MRARGPVLVFLSCLLAIAAAPSPGVHGEHGETYQHEGEVLVPNPAIAAGGTLAEISSPCDPSGTLQGFDGYWIDLEERAGHFFLMEVDPAADYDAYFYDFDCQRFGWAGAALHGIGETEGALIPDAAYVAVGLFAGHGNFYVTIW